MTRAALVAALAVVSLSAGTLLGATLPALPEVTRVRSYAGVSVTLRTMSVYSPKYIGRKMANGEPYNPHALTVARDRKSTRLNSSHIQKSRMPSSA